MSLEDIVYISRSRLGRNRANLIQTLHTAAAFQQSGVRVRLYMPSWPINVDFNQRVMEMGLHSDLDVRPSQLLRSWWRRFGFRPFVQIHRARLRKAGAVYTRSVEVSSALASAGIVHNLEVHESAPLFKEGDITRIVKQHHSGVIDWLVPISQAMAVILVDAGAVPERIHVSPNGVDVDAFKQIEPFDAKHLDHPRVTYIGRISNDRGLAVFQALAKSGIVHVTLAGEQDDLVQSSSSLRVEPFIPHRDVPNCYGRTDLVLLPYQAALNHAETISPIKLFEALAAGRPIIASDLPPIREILDHEKTGLLVEPGNIDAWIRAIHLLQENRGLATRLAQAAREIAPRFSWKKRAEGIARALGRN